jgi:hypothetical protein
MAQSFFSSVSAGAVARCVTVSITTGTMTHAPDPIRKTTTPAMKARTLPTPSLMLVITSLTLLHFGRCSSSSFRLFIGFLLRFGAGLAARSSLRKSANTFFNA